jgi:DinB superfamily
MSASPKATSTKERAREASARIEEGRRRLEAVSTLDPRSLTRSYAPGKWNGFELFGHLADCDLVYYTRFLKVIAEEGVPIVPFDQDRWTVELRVKERPIAVSMAAITAGRAGLRHYLDSMPENVLERRTLHPERGPMSALDLAENAAKHAFHHLEQIEAIRDGRTWTPKS